MLAHPGETRTIKTIEQHFHWQTLSRDVKQFIQTCQTCQHYKRQCKNYGHLPTKIQHDIEPWNEVHVDLIGPWIILQRPSKSPKLSAKPDMKQPLQVLALTMIDPSTNLLELIVVSDKEVAASPSQSPRQSSNQCNPRTHPPSNRESTLIPSLDVHRTELFGRHPT
jgi:hypothetical protein